MPEHEQTLNLEGGTDEQTIEESSTPVAEESTQDTTEKSPDPVPYTRFKEVNDQKGAAVVRAERYESLGSPEEIQEALEIASTILQKQRTADEAAAVAARTPEQKEKEDLRKQVLELIEPEMKELHALRQRGQVTEESTKAHQEVVLSRATDRLGTLLKETGFEPDEHMLEEVGESLYVMGARDPKNIQRFRSGDVKVVDELYSAWKKRYLEPAARKHLADAEAAKKGGVVPRIPEGGGYTPAQTQKKAEAGEQTEKTAHDLAWDLLQEMEKGT